MSEEDKLPSRDVLIALNRSATTARLLAGAVHEVNNALQVISGTVEILQGRTDLGDPVIRALERVRTQTGRAASALADVTVFTKGAVNESARVDIREAVAYYLGVSYDEREIEAAADAGRLPYRRVENVAADVARRLAAGEVIGVLHGRDEWGPRALGGRSILADPRRPGMKDHLNARIKFREEFRPFAPVVLEESYGDYFETLGMPSSPYMLFTHKALRPAETGAVVHVDSTSRVQTVNRDQDSYLYDIIREFKALTGVPVVINTSFNLKGEPIVSSPADAFKTFMASGIDSLALEHHIVTKTADTLPADDPRALAFAR